MSAVTLIEVRPRRVADGVEVVVRLVHNARTRANFFGQQWLPLVSTLPTLESQLGFDGQRFGNGATPVVGQMEIVLDITVTSWATLLWKGASIAIKRADWPAGINDPVDGAFATWWSGRCDSAAVEDGLLRVTMLDAGDVLRRPLITRQFGSSGVAVLDAAPAAAQKGNPVPIGWGRLEGVPGLLLDNADLIYFFNGQAATSVSAFYDGGAAFTLGVARASLAALRANVPAAGAVDYCLDAGGLMLARPWTTPVYPFTADMIVGDPKAANIASAVVGSRTALAFKAGVVAAFNGVQAADCGLYVADTKTIAEVLDQIFAGLGAWWKLTSAGEIDIRQFGYAGAALRTFGRWTRGHVTRKEFVMPTRRRSLGYKPNWRVHGENEIAKSLLLTASDVKYADGTLIEALKPAQAAADVTAQQQIVVTVPALVTYGADSSGAIIGTITSESIRVARGGASIKLDNGTSYAITPLGGITAATVDNVNGSGTKGDISGITFGGNTGTIEVVVTVGGVAQPKQIIQFAKDIAAPPATGGSGSKTASDTSLGYCSATTDTVLSDTLTVTIASGESLYGTAPLDFEIDGTTTANRSASCKWQYFAASTWNDFVAGTYVNSSVNAYSGRYSGGEWLDPLPGSIAVTQTKGGLGAGDYPVRLVGKLSAVGRTASFYGTARVEAKV